MVCWVMVPVTVSVSLLRAVALGNLLTVGLEWVDITNVAASGVIPR